MISDVYIHVLFMCKSDDTWLKGFHTLAHCLHFQRTRVREREREREREGIDRGERGRG